MAFMAHTGAEQVSDYASYLDGGATDHMSDRLEWFTSISEVPKRRWPVMIADNRQLWIRGVGKIQIECLIDNNKTQRRTLDQVLYVPALRKNLFSVGMAADRGFVTTYTRSTCYLTSHEGKGQVVLTGIRADRLYQLKLSVTQPSCQAYLICTEGTM